MPKRKLTIVERGLYKFAVCEHCNTEFKSSLLNLEAAETEIREKFATHRCKPPESYPNAVIEDESEDD